MMRWKAVLLCVLACSMLSSPSAVLGAGPKAKVEIDSSSAQPRGVEDATKIAIARDYSLAWQNLAAAMENNRTELLDAVFVGFARDKFAQGIASQRESGLRRRLVDRSHRVEVVFYSYDGSAMQLRDTAEVEVQLLDGSKVVATEPATIHYVVLMTPAENSWKVRDMEAVPAF